MPAPEGTGTPFVHLHVHTEYSLLDGACRIRDLIAACKKMEMPAVAITDHGNLFGAIEFYQAAVEAGVKPIIGCELYLAPGDRREKQVAAGRETAYHQLLLAMDLEGYRNLIKLASIGYTEGFYYKPRIDKAVLREFHRGLICTSTCLGGEIPQELLRSDAKRAKAVAEEFLDIFGPERFFIELQNHGLKDQAVTNPELKALAERLGVGVIATNDVHYLTHDDVEAHDVLCCISTRARVSEENRFKFESDQFYLKSPAEMAAALPEYPQALANTLRIAELCNVQFDFSKRYAPVFRPPDQKSADDYLRELVYQGAAWRYGSISDELRERIDYELSVICGKGFAGYFLIVWDFVRFARESDIPAVARGSGCSTVVGYCLGVSNVDPLRYGLYFERFMDPERDEMPDIDVDICQDRRPEVIDYVRNKYGHVAQIITFGRLKARAAIRDICRALEVPLSEADRIAKLVPEELKMTIEKALEREPELRRMVESDATIRKVIDLGQRLEGLARHASIHAAGVVIADSPLDTLVPLYKPADSRDVTTQFEGPTVEKVGLLKMDFLGLRTLSQLHLACKLVEKHHGVRIDLDGLDLTDQRVFALLARGETRGVFQFESGGMRDVLMKMKPNRTEDLIAANALFRPGPMAYIEQYVARKHGKERWETPHPIMTEVLRETYGIMVYQEQVSRLVNRLGDVPLRRAFRLAKAISKKKESMINAEREPFLEGCAKNGVKRDVGEQIFADILKFGGYAFNKAHSTGYAVVAFQTAYLKTYFPAEFMAALLTYESGSTEKVAEYIDECRRIRWPDGGVGVDVLPPDVNESEEAFTVVYGEGSRGQGVKGPRGQGAQGPRGQGVEDAREGSERVNGDSSARAVPGTRWAADRTPSAPGPLDPSAPSSRGFIRFGLTAISGVGQKAVQAVLAARGGCGRFRDIFDFCERVEMSAINRAMVEALIKAGAFDTTGALRRGLMDVLEKALDLGGKAQRDKKAGQLDMFGQFVASAPPPPPPIPASEWTDAEMLTYEKEALGFYITRHPLTPHERLIQALGSADVATLKHYGDGQRVCVGGLISKVRSVPIKNGRSAGKKLLIAQVEDFSGSIEAILFPESAPQLAPLLRPDAVVFVSGAVDTRREEPSLRIANVTPIEAAVRKLSSRLMLRLDERAAQPEALAGVLDLCRRHRGLPGEGGPGGAVEVWLRLERPDEWSTLVRSRAVSGVDPTPELLRGLARLLGPANVECCGPRGAVVVDAAEG